MAMGGRGDQSNTEIHACTANCGESAWSSIGGADKIALEIQQEGVWRGLLDSIYIEKIYRMTVGFQQTISTRLAPHILVHVCIPSEILAAV